MSLVLKPWHVPVVTVLVTVAQSQDGVFPGGDGVGGGSIIPP